MNTIIKQKTFLVGAVFLIGLSTVFAQAQGSKPLKIGIIGKPNSGTAQGVELAAERFSQQGNITTPDGRVFKLAVVAQDASTADDVGSAITTLKNQDVAAIFGPDDATLTLASLNTLNNAGVPIFTSVQDPAITTGGLLFRTRANDSRNMNALVNYLTKDLGKSQIAVFQGDQAFQARVQLFTTTLTQNNLKAATTVVQVSGGTVASSVQVLLQAKPDAVMAFGGNDQVVTLLQELHSQSYTGVVVYPDAVDHTYISSLTSDMRTGLLASLIGFIAHYPRIAVLL
jgi:ABC-type branched-subunit amino acid transport system substrate-binding protein